MPPFGRPMIWEPPPLDEGLERLQCFLRRLLGEEVATGQGAAGHLPGARGPQLQHVVAALDDALPAPQHQQRRNDLAVAVGAVEIGRASCRESVCQYVYISVVAVSLKKTKQTK